MYFYTWNLIECLWNRKITRRFSYFLLQIEEFTGLTDEQRTAFKWKFLLERCKIHMKVDLKNWPHSLPLRFYYNIVVWQTLSIQSGLRWVQIHVRRNGIGDGQSRSWITSVRLLTQESNPVPFFWESITKWIININMSSTYVNQNI